MSFWSILPYFEKYFPDQQWISQRIKELSDIRILVAHNSIIHKEQKDLIRIYYRQIIAQIHQGMNED